MKMFAIFAVALSMAAVSVTASAATFLKLHAEGVATGPALAGGLIYNNAPIVVDAMFDLSEGLRTTIPGQDLLYNAGEASVALDLLSGTWGNAFSAIGFFNGSMTSGLGVSLLDPDLKYLLTVTVNRSGHEFVSLDTPPLGNVCAGARACFGRIIDPDGGTDLNNVQIIWSSVTLSAESPAVPEPSTWALMIIGFGSVGVLLRRRSRSVVTY